MISCSPKEDVEISIAIMSRFYHVCPSKKRRIEVTLDAYYVSCFLPIILDNFSEQETVPLPYCDKNYKSWSFLSDTGESSQRIIERALDFLHYIIGTRP